MQGGGGGGKGVRTGIVVGEGGGSGGQGGGASGWGGQGVCEWRSEVFVKFQKNNFLRGGGGGGGGWGGESPGRGVPGGGGERDIRMGSGWM